tara:strand:- start:1602 stop:1829 length:228 start_codon:yes stop_codon:yes gene_type:complete
MLALPEVACAQWLSFAPADMHKSGTLARLFARGETALDIIATMSATYGVSILVGTNPFPTETVDSDTAISIGRGC